MSLTAFAPSFIFSSSVSLSQILRDRRIFASQELERVCQEAIQPRILSFHNGWMREADPVLPLCAAQSGEWVALDSDFTRLAELKSEYGASRIRCVHESTFPDGNEEVGAFHYVYALNHLSELNDRAARRALERMRRFLRRGGTALIASFTPEAAHLHWNGNCPPFLRDEQQIAALASGLTSSLDKRLRGRASWCDQSGMIAYLQMEAD